VPPLGYCERGFRARRKEGSYRERGGGADIELCCDEGTVPPEGALPLRLESDMRFISGVLAAGGCGERAAKREVGIAVAEPRRPADGGSTKAEILLVRAM